MNEEILRVTPDGKFIWHNNADKLIETGDFTEAPAMPHILRRLRRLSAVETQRDALLEKIKAVIAAEQSEGAGRGGFVNTPPTREHQRRVAQAWQELHAAIKAVEVGK